MRRTRHPLALPSAILLLCAPWSADAVPDLIGVTELGLKNGATGRLSTDGSVLPAAEYDGSEQTAVYWEVGTAMPPTVVPLGSLGAPPEDNDYQAAVAASHDGSVIVGVADNEDGMPEAYRWTAAGGMVGLGFLSGPGDPTSSTAIDVSGDGSVIIGESSASILEPHTFYWTQGGGMIDIGDLPGGDTFARAQAVSKDGSTVVGLSRSANGNEAFRWTEAGGMIGLGDLPGGTFLSNATDVSADGTVVVGWSRTANGDEAFRWTAASGLQMLAGVPAQSKAWGVSSDGNVVVGEYQAAFGTQSAFVWDTMRGFQDLTTLLIDQGVSLDIGWVFPFQQALVISDDGTVLEGTGTLTGSGFQEFVVTAFSLPEPAVGLSGIAAWTAVALLRRWRSAARRRTP